MIRRGSGTPAVVAPVYVNGVAVARQLGKTGVYVVGVDCQAGAPGLHSKFVKERVVIQSPSESDGSFARFLLSRKDLYGALVIPTDDFHLRDLYRNRESLEGKYRLCISRGRAAEIALDKALTAEAVAQADIPAPRTRLVSADGELQDAASYVRFPALVKPTFSISFSRKFHTKSFFVTNEEELRSAFAKSRHANETVVLQEFIPGPDSVLATYVSYWDDRGRLVGDFAARKLLQHPPLFGVGQVHRVERLPEVIHGCRRLLTHLGYAGAVTSSEWKYDERDRTWKFLELNARTHMQIALAKPAGCDVVEMMRRDKLGLPQIEPGDIRHGLKWIYVKNGILRQLGYPEHRQSLAELVETYSPPVVFALLSLEDPRPFFVDILPLLTRRIRPGLRFAPKPSLEPAT